MKNESNDRIEQGLSYWKDREKKLQELTGPAITTKRHFFKEKLQYYISLRDQYKKSELTPGEKSNRRILKGEIKEIEKQLYPNRIERLVRRGVEQMKKLLEPLKIPEKTVAFVNKLPLVRRNPSDITPGNNQLQNQDQNQKASQNMKQDSVVQSQKHGTVVQRTIEPQRHIIINGALRKESRINNNLNNTPKIAKPKRTQRHRLH